MGETIANVRMASWSAGTRDRGRYVREIGEEPSRMSRERIISVAKGSEPERGETFRNDMLVEAWKSISGRFALDPRHPVVVGDFVEHYQTAFYRDGET